MKIAVLCSGGDAPGMNACVRSVVRSGRSKGHQVLGIMCGYQGLLEEHFFVDHRGPKEMTFQSVHNWSSFGGAFLRSSRSDHFRTEEGQKQAAEILHRNDIGALITIGGDGTLNGAVALSKFYQGQIIGAPGTIDNDLKGTDYTIGFSTAVATATEAIDKIRDTAESHERMFLVEVMGRHSGYIAAISALAGGADVAAVPETRTDFVRITAQLDQIKKSGGRSAMIIVAEGDQTGGAEGLKTYLEAHQCPFPIRTVVLGHLQRGGRPTAEDRWRAAIIGDHTINAIDNGEHLVMVGTDSGLPTTCPIAHAIDGHRPIPDHILKMVNPPSN